jgi:hypothetical protein
MGNCYSNIVENTIVENINDFDNIPTEEDTLLIDKLLNKIYLLELKELLNTRNERYNLYNEYLYINDMKLYIIIDIHLYIFGTLKYLPKYIKNKINTNDTHYKYKYRKISILLLYLYIIKDKLNEFNFIKSELNKLDNMSLSDKIEYVNNHLIKIEI